MKDKWISVKDRLPDKIVLALQGKIIIRAVYIKEFEEECLHYDDCDCEYNEERDLYFIPEGWYECMNNWDDYSSVKVPDGEIKLWTELPKLPEKPDER